MRTLALTAVVAALVTTGCRKPDVAGADRPFVVLFGPLHGPGDPVALQARLARDLGFRLEVKTASSDEEALDLVASRRADAALVSVFGYLLAADLYGVEPVAKLVRGHGETTHEGAIFARDDGPATLAELAGRPVAYVDRFSVTGFILAEAKLRESGVGVKPAWLATHGSVVEAVKAKRVAAGATYLRRVEGQPGLRVLARTGPMENEPLFVQPSVAPEVRGKLAASLRSLDADVLAGVADATGFTVPAADAYQQALATVQAAGRRVEDLVPGGWRRGHEARRASWTYAP